YARPAVPSVGPPLVPLRGIDITQGYVNWARELSLRPVALFGSGPTHLEMDRGPTYPPPPSRGLPHHRRPRLRTKTARFARPARRRVGRWDGCEPAGRASTRAASG